MVRRAVHRLERHVVLASLLVEHEEHVLAIDAPVPGDLPEALVVEQGSLDLLVSVALQLAEVRVELVDDRRTALRPERRARREVMEEKQVELLAEHAVIAALGLLDAKEIRVELVLLEPRRPIDPLQHLTALVAAPVRTGGVQQLEMLELPRIRHVRATAEVHERAIAIHTDDLVVAKLGESLELERIVGENALRFGACHLLALEGKLLGDDLAHLLLEGLEVVGSERLLDLEIVIEAVVDRRAQTRSSLPGGGGARPSPARAR